MNPDQRQIFSTLVALDDLVGDAGQGAGDLGAVHEDGFGCQGHASSSLEAKKSAVRAA